MCTGTIWSHTLHYSRIGPEQPKGKHSAGVSRDSSVVERRTRDKIAGTRPDRSGGRIFASRVNFLCWLLFPYSCVCVCVCLCVCVCVCGWVCLQAGVPSVGIDEYTFLRAAAVRCLFSRHDWCLNGNSQHHLGHAAECQRACDPIHW